jgi:hypothetical protein
MQAGIVQQFSVLKEVIQMINYGYLWVLHPVAHLSKMKRRKTITGKKDLHCLQLADRLASQKDWRTTPS